jgi:hypothetical protein
LGNLFLYNPAALLLPVHQNDNLDYGETELSDGIDCLQQKENFHTEKAFMDCPLLLANHSYRMSHRVHPRDESSNDLHPRSLAKIISIKPDLPDAGLPAYSQVFLGLV